MALDSYANLKTAVSAWVERATDTVYVAEVDTFIDLAEAKFNRFLVNHYKMDGDATLTTDSSGEVTLPTDYLAYKSVIWDGSRDLPMKYVTWNSLQYLNPSNVAGVPNRFSIRGTTLKVGPIAEGDILFSYSAKLTPLDGSNTTNWLLEIAPDAYLFMSIAAGHAFNEDFQRAAAMEAKAMDSLEDVGVLGDLGQYNNAGVTLSQPTP